MGPLPPVKRGSSELDEGKPVTGSGCEDETTQMREEGPGGLSVLVGWGGKGEDDHHGDCAGGADGRKERAAGVGVGHKPAPPEGGHGCE